MQRVDQTAADAAPSWEEDTIYCEATCDPENIFYEGSDDEDYENPEARKLQYERVGQRFLDGLEPIILTASLQGPFDRASGWINPWRSKRRTAKDPRLSRASREKPDQPQRYRRRVSIPETQDETQNSLDCHLPSPESLKQVSVVESHPYLMENDLVKVQNWRAAVEPVSSTRDRFWVTTPRESNSVRKRKASGSDWLKKLATKRRRTSLLESGSVNTPVPRRTHTDPTLLRTLTDDDPTASFNNIRSQHIPSSFRSKSMRAASSLKVVRNQVDEEDELVMSKNNSSFHSTQPITSTRRISPIRDVQPTRDDTANEEDELSQEQIAAAATLSSPISQRTHPKSSLHYSSFQINSSQVSLEQQSPTKRKASAPLRLPQASMDDLASTQDVVMEELTQEAIEALESQRDQSFCFKMRRKADGDNKTGPEHPSAPAATYNEEHARSGLSSQTSSSPVSANDVAPANIDSPVVKLGEAISRSTSNAASDDTSGQIDVSSSDLSSLQSRYFDGFRTPGHASEDHMDVDTAETTEDVAEETIQVILEEQPIIPPQKSYQSSPAVVPKRHELVPAVPSSPPRTILNQVGSNMEHSQVVADDDADESSNSPFSSLDDQDMEDLVFMSQAVPSSTGSRLANNATSKPSSGALLLKKSVRQFLPSLLPRLQFSPLTLTTTKVQDGGITQEDEVSTASEESSEEEDSEEEGVEEAMEEEENEEEDNQSSAAFVPELVSAPNLESEDEIIPESPVLQPVMENLVPSVKEPPATQLDEPQDEVPHNPGDSERPQDQVPGYPGEREEPQDQTIKAAIKEAAPTEAEETDVDQAESQPDAISQQTPWAGKKLSQLADLADEHLSQEGDATGQAKTPRMEQGAVTTSPEVQSPWAEERVKLPTISEALVSREHCLSLASPLVGLTSFAKTSPGDIRLQKPEIAAAQLTTPRPSTPEPQFTFKSFASFMSPSPERRSRGHRASWRDSGSRMPSTQGILASAMKNPWAARSSRSDRRVSWKPLPGATELLSTPAVASSVEPSSQLRGRDSSPPPPMPVADLPTSEDEKFHDHFKAIIIRRKNRQALLPSESQRTLRSPEVQAMAEKFIAADEGLPKHSVEEEHDSGEAEKGENTEETEDAESLPTMKSIEYSQDSNDIVEDVFRDIDDYLETWNVDTELDQARGGSSVPTPRVDPTVQSPW